LLASSERRYPQRRHVVESSVAMDGPLAGAPFEEVESMTSAALHKLAEDY
jgi:hypothetical protein